MRTTTQRGYGAAHQAERKKYQPIIDAGEGVCAEFVCYHETRRIHPGEKWELAHTPDRSGYRGPAHQLCNRKERHHHRDSAADSSGWIL